MLNMVEISPGYDVPAEPLGITTIGPGFVVTPEGINGAELGAYGVELVGDGLGAYGVELVGGVHGAYGVQLVGNGLNEGLSPEMKKGLLWGGLAAGVLAIGYGVYRWRRG